MTKVCHRQMEVETKINKSEEFSWRGHFYPKVYNKRVIKGKVAYF